MRNSTGSLDFSESSVTNQHRYKVNFTNPDSGMNKCSTLIGGVGILLSMASLAFFGKGDIHGHTLIYIVVLVALNFLSYHARFFRVVIAIISGVIGLGFIVSSLPDFIADNLERSQLGFYYMFVGFYSIGVCFCQINVLVKKNSHQ